MVTFIEELFLNGEPLYISEYKENPVAKKLACTYILYNCNNREFYIGSTKNLRTRLSNHFNMINRSEHNNKKINNWNIIDVFYYIYSNNPLDELPLIEKYSDSSNIVNEWGVLPHRSGFNLSQDHKDKIRLKNKGHKLAESSKKIISEKAKERIKKNPDIVKTNLGRKLSQEWCNNISKAKTGEKNPFYGKEHSQETRNKIGAKNSKPCTINGVYYKSRKEALNILKISTKELNKLINSSNDYPEREYNTSVLETEEHPN